MEWVLAHLKLILIIGFFIASWLGRRTKKTEEPAPARTPSSRPVERTQPAMPVSPLHRADESDAVRRVQDEIRRKIMERAAGGTPAPRPPPLPASNEPTLRPVAVPSAARTEPRRKHVVVAAPVPAPLSSEVLAAEMSRLEQRRREAKKVSQAEIQDRNASAAAGTDGQNVWTSELRDPVQLRRAFILSEILARPVSLR